MKIVADEIAASLQNSSWIRRMFEAGMEMKKQRGAENVFDFSLGNPDVPPPPRAKAVLEQIAERAVQPLGLGYMPNAGMPELREALAKKLCTEQQVQIAARQVVVSCGAAGAITSFFRAVLEPGDEVLVSAPYFVEYGFYCGHFGGKLKAVPSKKPDFDLDVDAMAAAITDKTRVIIINSPNNPTGCIYPEASLKALAAAIDKANAARERPIFLLSDEPYRLFAFDDAIVPPVLPLTPFAVVLGSFSKSLSLAGERIGYIAISPDMPEGDLLMNAVTLTTRTLGFVNAPIIGQLLALNLLDEQVDLEIYDRRRKTMARVLTEAGITFTMPRGAFYFFPEAPGGDDLAFSQRLMGEGILAVPGRGFGMPGYVRLCSAVDETIINRSAEAFKKAMA